VRGLAVATGIVSKTGIAGLTLGGGVGWLSRKYGLTCDNLLSCEVVNADGKILTASKVSNPDLFWGLRGGGGNFGIVTSFLYQAHAVSTVLGGLLLYPRDQARTVLRFYRDFMIAAPDELTAYAGLISTPDGMPVVAVMVCHCGDPAEGERDLKPLRAFGSPFQDTIGSMPFHIMQRLAEGEGRAERTHNYWRSTFLKDLSDAAIDLIIEHGNRIQSPLSRIVIQLFGGAIGRFAPTDTAFPHRQANFNVAIEAEWLDPAESSGNIIWTCDLSAALQPYSSNGVFLNYLGDEGRESVRKTFGENYERLVDIKTKYDPSNFFSLNQNIEPRRRELKENVA
jgi:FAD/FMN-containing dehydrogenase